MSTRRRDPTLPDRWLDEVMVDRVLAGTVKTTDRLLSPAERVEVARRVLAAGGGYNRLMRLLRCNGDAAKRLVKEARAVVVS